MKHLIGSLLAACLLVGSVAVHREANAQSAKPAYVIILQQTTDDAKFQPLLQRFASLVTKTGGKYVVRGKAYQVIEGDALDRVTIIEFNNREAAEKFSGSPEYKQILADRKALVKNSHIVVVDGL